MSKILRYARQSPNYSPCRQRTSGDDTCILLPRFLQGGTHSSNSSACRSLSILSWYHAAVRRISQQRSRDRNILLCKHLMDHDSSADRVLEARCFDYIVVFVVFIGVLCFLLGRLVGSACLCLGSCFLLSGCSSSGRCLRLRASIPLLIISTRGEFCALRSALQRRFTSLFLRMRIYCNTRTGQQNH